MYVSMLLWRFEIGVVGKGEGGEKVFTEVEDRNPPIGVMGPKRGMDSAVEVRKAGR